MLPKCHLRKTSHLFPRLFLCASPLTPNSRRFSYGSTRLTSVLSEDTYPCHILTPWRTLAQACLRLEISSPLDFYQQELQRRALLALAKLTNHHFSMFGRTLGILATRYRGIPLSKSIAERYARTLLTAAKSPAIDAMMLRKGTKFARVLEPLLSSQSSFICSVLAALRNLYQISLNYLFFTHYLNVFALTFCPRNILLLFT